MAIALPMATINAAPGLLAMALAIGPSLFGDRRCVARQVLPPIMVTSADYDGAVIEMRSWSRGGSGSCSGARRQFTWSSALSWFRRMST